MDNKRKFLLVNPNQMKPAVAPLALDYLSHALQQHQFQVDLLDLCFSSDTVSPIEDYFAHNSVIAVGISLRNTDDTYFASQDFFIPELKEVIDCIKAQTKAPLILGGSGFSIMPEAILDYCDLDLGIWGEGEYSLPLLITKIASNQDCRDVPALVYRTRGGFHRNPPKYIDLSSLPAPERNTVDNPRYFVEGGMGNIECGRGCSKKCIYCADPLGKGTKLRLRSPNSLVDEMEMLLRMGIDHLHFCDSEFNLPPNHAEEVCFKMVERGLGTRLRWYAYCSPVPFPEEMANLFQRAGCAGLNFGVDSGSDQVLPLLGRDFTVEDIRHTAEICHRYSIIFMCDLLLGGPGETRETMRQTIETMKRLSPNRVGVSIGVRIFPQTRLAAMVKSQGAFSENPNLQGKIEGNQHFFAPIFYLSSALRENPLQYLADLVAGDERFFFGSADAGDKNYNYNDNELLVNAIKAGYRGAFWDILRRLSEEG